MTRHITQRELRNDSAAILRAVENGEDFILTRNGTPIAEVRPIRRHTFVPVDELMRLTAHLPRIDFDEFRADLDAVVDPYLDDPYERRGHNA
ncbi:MAG: type II toxin-antitoxin system prevent-host-death family antitoxin [Kutzneria sp.]|nr:type II toxin-antitoxin system prevent-host-death family antitoxin [Kutzneria sp.]MBV9847595.1 type II toxin-antitoxin system prevent-host-death family antitoxin [Kutzneria sp.]